MQRTLWVLLAIGLLIGEPARVVAGTILGTDGSTCYPRTFGTSLVSTIRVYGDWIETIDQATTTASGVSVSIVAKKNGLQNNTEPFKGKGMVSLKISTNNASAGNKTIRLNGGIFGTATFTITIQALPTVTSVDVPELPDPFREVTVTFHGTGLQNAQDPASAGIISSDLIPLITVGGNVSVSSLRVLNSSNTSLQARLFLTALVQDITLDFRFRTTQSCVPLINGLTHRIRLKSTNIKNYVKDITFPNGSTFDVNSTGTIHIELLFPAPGSSTSSGLTLSPNVRPIVGISQQLLGDLKQRLAASTLLRNANSTVFFQLVPRDAFEAVVGGTPINPNGLTEVKAGPGENIIPITFKVKNCLGGQPGTTNVVRIQTWMHNTNRNLPPEFVEKEFRVRCIQ